MKAIIDGEEHAAELTKEHSSSNYGRPVLVVDGQAYGTGDAWPELQLSDEEWKALHKAGYFVRKARRGYSSLDERERQGLDLIYRIANHVNKRIAVARRESISEFWNLTDAGAFSPVAQWRSEEEDDDNHTRE